ncbi:MAG: thymidine kinase [Fimbriimonadia bacterium]|jgi:thymidine kinase
MFAGKSEELIRLIRRSLYAKKKVQVFKHAYDTRYSETEIATHEGVKLNAIAVRSSADLEKLLIPDTEVVAIEEAQFFDMLLPDLCNRLADKGKTVLVAGLDQDFRREPFGPMPKLLALADEVVKLRAICVRCGNTASHTQRLVDGRPASYHDPIVLIGASERYEARCRHCHELPDAPKPRRRTYSRSSGNQTFVHEERGLFDDSNRT